MRKNGFFTVTLSEKQSWTKKDEPQQSTFNIECLLLLTLEIKRKNEEKTPRTGQSQSCDAPSS